MNTPAFEFADFEFEDESRRPPAARPRPPTRRPPPRPSGQRPGLGPRGYIGAPCVCPAHGTEYVRWVQSALNRIDGAGLAVDGVMGAAARAALRRFQSRSGLPADGIAGPDTEQALRSGGSSPADTAAPDQGEIFEFETLAFESAPSRPTLRYGSRGAAVTELQQRLANAGYDPGPIDGIFGSRTTAAVRAFQSARRLLVDGIVGPQTWGALLGSTPVPPGGGGAPGGGTASDEWVLPAAVRAAGDAQTVRYDDAPAWSENPSSCTGPFTAGARILRDHILATFPGVSSIGGFSCRPNSASPSRTSVHGTGRALDIMINTVGGKANGAVGDPIANWLIENAQAIGVQFIIWNHMKWNGSFPAGTKFAPYTPPNKHIDHIHAEINEDAAARRTPWFRGR